mmetsp:Transcript_14604/g.47709  ORF Transcript_14604/g.47709 Transcript_14604/m.47709 type:complete len:213 (+) Transcript_14604:184-822(+)
MRWCPADLGICYGGDSRLWASSMRWINPRLTLMPVVVWMLSSRHQNTAFRQKAMQPPQPMNVPASLMPLLTWLSSIHHQRTASRETSTQVPPRMNLTASCRLSVTRWPRLRGTNRSWWRQSPSRFPKAESRPTRRMPCSLKLVAGAAPCSGLRAKTRSPIARPPLPPAEDPSPRSSGCNMLAVLADMCPLDRCLRPPPPFLTTTSALLSWMP